jgi:glycosyltransferase involved in cell wall biosynthesis
LARSRSLRRRSSPSSRSTDDGDALTPGYDAKRVFQNATGLGSYGRFVLRTLVERFPDSRCLLYTPRVDPEVSRDVSAVISNAARVPPPGFRSGPGAALWRTYLLGRRAARDGATLFHGLSQELPRDLPRKFPAVVSILDLLPFRHPEFFPRFDRAVYRWKVRWSLDRADLIVTASHRTASDLTTFCGVDQGRVRVIPIGAHPRYRQRLSADTLQRFREAHRLPSEYLLMVGRLERRKNAILGLRALRLLAPDERPVMVLVGGRGETRYARLLEAYVAEHRLGSWVRFLGRVRSADLPAIYQAATALLYLSLFEGFGIPVLEAMISGVPVIAARGSSLEEVGGDAPHYIDPEDPEELAEVLRDVLESELLRTEMVVKGHRHTARFGDHALADAMMGVYRELL